VFSFRIAYRRREVVIFAFDCTFDTKLKSGRPAGNSVISSQSNQCMKTGRVNLANIPEHPQVDYSEQSILFTKGIN